jgi:hypothetical protein
MPRHPHRQVHHLAAVALLCVYTLSTIIAAFVGGRGRMLLALDDLSALASHGPEDVDGGNEFGFRPTVVVLLNLAGTSGEQSSLW